MRIGMMADLYKPHISGVTNYIALNKLFLEKFGHQVYVFTFGDEDYPDDEERVVRSPGLRLKETDIYISLRYTNRARRLLREMDIVHVNHPLLSGSLALRYCRSRGIPIVFTNHTRYDLYMQAYIPGLPEFVGNTAFQAFMPSFCRSCDLVIAPSKGMRNILEGFGVDVPIDVVPNGVDLRPFQSHLQPKDRGELGIKPDDLLLVYSGRLGPEKNLPFLIRSFCGVARAYEKVHLMILGDGTEREKLEELATQLHIKQRVHFTGMVPYPEVPQYLVMADAMVTASVTEVHPLSVIESMAAGLPVLGIDSPGVGDTIQDGVTGYLAQEEDIASFTAKMVKLVTETQSRQKMGENARQAAEIYAIDHTAKQLEERYDKAIHIAANRKRGIGFRFNRWLDQIRPQK